MNLIIIILFIFIFILFFTFIFTFIFTNYDSIESFTQEQENTWPRPIIDKFLEFERSFYPKLDIDLNILMKQASVNEVKYLMKHYKWPWSTETKDKYKEAIRRHPTIKSIPEESLLEAQKIYNENAINQLLFYNTKEGAFILDGVSVGPETVYKCSEKDELEKIEFNGYDCIYGNVLTTISKVQNENIPNEIPGFVFTGGKSCNPCSINSSCDFSVKNINY